MDLQALDRTVEFYFQNGLAASTRRAYGSAKSRYARFCSSNSLTPLPASGHQLCQFVSHLANENLCHSTIKCYLSAIRHLHVAEGYGDPNICNMARLEQVLKGIKSIQAKSLKKPTRLPIIIPRVTAENEIGLDKRKREWQLGQYNAMGSLATRFLWIP